MIGAMGFPYAQRITMLLTATFSELIRRRTSSGASQASTNGRLAFENERFSRSTMRLMLKHCGGDGTRHKGNGTAIPLKELGNLDVRQVLEKPNRLIDERQKIPLMRLLMDFCSRQFLACD